MFHFVTTKRVVVHSKSLWAIDFVSKFTILAYSIGSLVYNFEYAVWETVNGYDNIFVQSTFQSNQIERAARAAGIASGDPWELPYCWNSTSVSGQKAWMNYAKELRCGALLPEDSWSNHVQRGTGTKATVPIFGEPLNELEHAWCVMMLGGQQALGEGVRNQFYWLLQALASTACIPYPDGSYSVEPSTVFIPTYIHNKHFKCLYNTSSSTCIQNITSGSGTFYYGVEDTRIYINAYYRSASFDGSNVKTFVADHQGNAIRCQDSIYGREAHNTTGGPDCNTDGSYNGDSLSFVLKDILTWSGLDLDNGTPVVQVQASLPTPEGLVTPPRIKGGTLLLIDEYSNLVHVGDTPSMIRRTLHFKGLQPPGAESRPLPSIFYGIDEPQGEHTYQEGLRFIFSTTGTLGVFSWSTLLVKMTSMVVLLGSAQVIVQYLAPLLYHRINLMSSESLIAEGSHLVFERLNFPGRERMLDLELEPLKHHKRSDVNLELEGSDQSVKASSESPDHHHHQGHHDHSSSRHRRHHRHHSKQVHSTSNGELSEAVDLNHPVIETIRI